MVPDTGVVLAFADSRYPAWLRVVADPPPVLWVRGDLGVLDTPSVAIVGSRAASQYAKTVAGSIAADLARAGLVVTSGLARGVDAAAHEGCLAGGGGTIAVVGTGIDVVYPPEHRALVDRIVARGLLVSEFAPGESPLAWHFPRRNRIISGLSRAVVVVEASEKSGSLITARMALEQGRDVMVVPGSVLHGRNRGAHALIKDGAMPVEDASDILDALGLGGRAAAYGTPCAAPCSCAHPVEAALIGAGSEGLDAGELAEATGLTVETLSAALTALELDERVERLSGGKFVTKSSSRTSPDRR